MMISSSFNHAASVAASEASRAQRGLAETVGAVGSARDVRSADQDPSTWAISATLDARIAGRDAVTGGLDLARATVAVGRNAAETVTDLLSSMKEIAIRAGATGGSARGEQRAFEGIRDQIRLTVGAAQFNGENLAADGAGLTVLASDPSEGADVIEVGGFNLGPDAASGGGLAALATVDLTTREGRADALEQLEVLLQTTSDAAAALGASERTLAGQADGLRDFRSIVETGLAEFNGIDLAQESAQRAAREAQAELAMQMQSIANSNPKRLLTLFG